MLLIDGDGDEPYLEVKEFCLPEKSKHLLVSEQSDKLSKRKIINNEDLLTPTKESFVEKHGDT